jgi:hypothetical protein
VQNALFVLRERQELVPSTQLRVQR